MLVYERDDITVQGMQVGLHFKRRVPRCASRRDLGIGLTEHGRAAAPTGPDRGQGLPHVPDRRRRRAARGSPHCAVRAQGVPALHMAQLLHNVVDILHLVHLAVSRVASRL